MYMILPCAFVEATIAAVSKTIDIITTIPTPINISEHLAERNKFVFISSLDTTNSFIDEEVTREPSMLLMVCLE